MSNCVVSQKRNDRVIHPPVSEIDARRLSPQLMYRRTCVGRVLKKCDSGFVPEASIQKQWRVYGRSEHRCRKCLRPVVHVCELVRPRLEMNLKARVAKLDERI